MADKHHADRGQALRPLQETWGFPKRSWRGFGIPFSLGRWRRSGALGSGPGPQRRLLSAGCGAQARAAASELLVMRAQGRVLRPEHGESAWGAGRISPECPTSRRLGSLGPLPQTLTPPAAEALSSAETTSRGGGRARQLIRLPVRRWKRDLAVAATGRLRPPHISGLGRGSRDPHPGAQAGAGVSRRACASRVTGKLVAEKGAEE